MSNAMQIYTRFFFGTFTSLLYFYFNQAVNLGIQFLSRLAFLVDFRLDAFLLAFQAIKQSLFLRRSYKKRILLLQ